MERQVKELKIDAWKMYTGAELGEKAWFMDDEKVAYPFWEKTKKLGIKNLCVHKGLPLGAFNEKACTPLDLEKAAKDWPDLNFIVYHSGFRGFGWLGQRHRRRRSWTRRPTTRRRSPGSATSSASSSRTRRSRTSTSSWAARSTSLSACAPETCMHMLGQMIQVAGADHILWGTDSIWNGSPQSQIERLRRLKIDRRADREVQVPAADRRGQGPDLRPERRASCSASTRRRAARRSRPTS